MTEENLQENIRTKYRYTSSFRSGFSLMWSDAIAIMISLTIGFFIVNAVNPSWINFKSVYKYTMFIPFAWIIIACMNLYPGILLSPEEEIKNLAMSTFFLFVGEALAMTTIKATEDLIPIAVAMVIAWLASTCILPFSREMVRRINSHKKWWGVPAVLFSKDKEAYAIAERLMKVKHYGYKPVLIITDRKQDADEFMGIPVREDSKEILRIPEALGIKVAIVCGYDKTLEKIQTAYRYFIRVPKDQLNTTMSMHMKNFGGILGFSSTNNLTRNGILLIKRVIDLAACIVASPFLLLVTGFIALLIKITSPGPVFYGHKRVGKNHKEFKCWKFRSMCIDADKKLEEILKNDPVRAMEWEKDRKFTDDPRVTKIGKLLRKTSLDELPQLWNVFTGEMALIGPRPVTEPELKKYGKFADYILSVKPGLSGMWQISGRSETGYEERVTLDTYYIQNWSLWLDIWILIKTIWVVINGRGAY